MAQNKFAAQQLEYISQAEIAKLQGIAPREGNSLYGLTCIYQYTCCPPPACSLHCLQKG